MQPDGATDDTLSIFVKPKTARLRNWAEYRLNKRTADPSARVDNSNATPYIYVFDR